MFNSTFQFKKEGALSLGFYSLSGFILGTYSFVLVSLIIHLSTAVSFSNFFNFYTTLGASTLLVLSSLIFSLPIAFSLFYLRFEKDPMYVRLKIHNCLSVLSEFPILILGLFFLVVLPTPFLSIWALLVFLTLPRFYFILDEQLSQVEPMAIEAGQSLGLSVWHQVWLLFFVKNFSFYFLQIFIVGVRALGILTPALAILSFYDQQEFGWSWLSYDIFQALIGQNTNVAQWVMWFLLLYLIAFLVESKVSRQRFENV